MAGESPPAILSQALNDDWDLDDSTTSDRLWTSPLGRFVAAFSSSPASVRLLALFAARRASACWRLYCDDTTPLDAIRSAEQCLAGGDPEALFQFLAPARPSFRGTPIVDCRECDTGCAATAVAHMARVFSRADPRDLALCLSSADMAFDQSPLGRRDQFRRWLLEVAVPAAIDHRELTQQERTSLQLYSVAELDLERERAEDRAEYVPPPPRKRWL